MNKRSTQKTIKAQKQVKISVDLGWKQLIAIVIMALVFFFLPIFIKENYFSESSSQINETYTAKALKQQTQGQVAGASISRYYQIPLLNFRFDTYLTEPATIVFSLTVVFFMIGCTLLLASALDQRRKSIYR